MIHAWLGVKQRQVKKYIYLTFILQQGGYGLEKLFQEEKCAAYYLPQSECK